MSPDKKDLKNMNNKFNKFILNILTNTKAVCAVALKRQGYCHAFSGTNPAMTENRKGMPMSEKNLDMNPFKPEVKNIRATLSLMNRKKEGIHVATSCK